MDQCPVFSKHWGSTQAHQNEKLFDFYRDVCNCSTADEDCERQGGEEHHRQRQRTQIYKTRPGEISGGALAACPLHLCCLRLRHLPNYPEHTNGVVQLCVDNNSKVFPNSFVTQYFPHLFTIAFHYLVTQ